LTRFEQVGDLPYGVGVVIHPSIDLGMRLGKDLSEAFDLGTPNFRDEGVAARTAERNVERSTRPR
jgi:hypothetical protein